MKKADYIIIDFDSTFISKESLDMLAESCIKKSKNCHKVIKQIQTITDQGMSGKIDFRDSLDRRIKLIKATKKDVVKVSRSLTQIVSKSFSKNKKFIMDNREKFFLFQQVLRKCYYLF